jgi:serine/threonine protein kinase
VAALRKKLFAGRFEIEEEAGAGSAGTVYRARDVGTGERVALKVLRTPVGHTSVQVLLAAALLAQGRGAEALAEVRGPLKALEEQGGRGFRAARTQIVAAEALAAAGEAAEARRILGLARDNLLRRAAGISDAALSRSFLHDVPENARTLALAASLLGPERG